MLPRNTEFYRVLPSIFPSYNGFYRVSSSFTEFSEMSQPGSIGLYPALQFLKKKKKRKGKTKTKRPPSPPANLLNEVVSRLFVCFFVFLFHAKKFKKKFLFRHRILLLRFRSVSNFRKLHTARPNSKRFFLWFFLNRISKKQNKRKRRVFFTGPPNEICCFLVLVF